jgi:hypothetical protein
VLLRKLAQTLCNRCSVRISAGALIILRYNSNHSGMFWDSTLSQATAYFFRIIPSSLSTLIIVPFNAVQSEPQTAAINIPLSWIGYFFFFLQIRSKRNQRVWTVGRICHTSLSFTRCQKRYLTGRIGRGNFVLLDREHVYLLAKYDTSVICWRRHRILKELCMKGSTVQQLQR